MRKLIAILALVFTATFGVPAVASAGNTIPNPKPPTFVDAHCVGTVKKAPSISVPADTSTVNYSYLYKGKLSGKNVAPGVQAKVIAQAKGGKKFANGKTMVVWEHTYAPAPRFCAVLFGGF